MWGCCVCYLIYTGLSYFSLYSKILSQKQRTSHGTRIISAAGNAMKSYTESRTLKKTSTSTAHLALTICSLTFAASATSQYQSDNHRSLKDLSTGMGNVIAVLVVIKT